MVMMICLLITSCSNSVLKNQFINYYYYYSVFKFFFSSFSYPLPYYLYVTETHIYMIPKLTHRYDSETIIACWNFV
jgi:hypothetical protein